MPRSLAVGDYQMRAETFGKLGLGAVATLLLGACATQEPQAVTVAPVPSVAAAPTAAVVTPAPSAAAAPADAGATGAIIGTVTGEPGMCYARDQSGRTIKIQCPPGY